MDEGGTGQEGRGTSDSLVSLQIHLVFSPGESPALALPSLLMRSLRSKWGVCRLVSSAVSLW